MEQLTLEIRHVGVDIRVERVDNHLAVGRAGNLDAAVDKAGGGRRALPGGILADVLGLGEEVGQDAAVQLGLAELAALEEGLAGAVEGAVQEGQEGQGLGRQDLLVRLVDLAEDGDALEDGLLRRHCGRVFLVGGVCVCVVVMERCRRGRVVVKLLLFLKRESNVESKQGFS